MSREGPLALNPVTMEEVLAVQGFSELCETVLVNFVQKCIFLGKEPLAFISLSEGSMILKMLRTTGLESYQPGTYGNIRVTFIS